MALVCTGCYWGRPYLPKGWAPPVTAGLHTNAINIIKHADAIKLSKTGAPPTLVPSTEPSTVSADQTAAFEAFFAKEGNAAFLQDINGNWGTPASTVALHAAVSAFLATCAVPGQGG